ncbi:hypothetical protein QAD02_006428 [Eretmocerus hayati]|uniref:Uncharacterized protein n=1 Tax=Eretmocerus hayati TaxID=131215 RepID=A0ACC2N1Z9_9HYME|nr:hypothetical protein QAD02_006428 [Eretmocerus hayati]
MIRGHSQDQQEHEALQKSFFEAVLNEDLESVSKFVKSGFRLFQSRQILCKNPQGMPLPREGDYPCYLDTIAHGNIELVTLILRAKPDLGCVDDQGNGPLQLATRLEDGQKRWRMVDLLMGAGVRPINENLKYRSTSVHEAVVMNDLELVKHFVNFGAKLNCFDFFGKFSPLHYAIDYALKDSTRSAMIENLVQLGADINLINASGSTVFHYLCESEKCTWNLVKLLLNLGAKINLANKANNSPLSLVAAHGNYELVKKMIIEFGADVNSTKQCTGSPLQIAVTRNDCKMIKLLLQTKANVHVVDEDGKNLLHYTVVKPLINQEDDDNPHTLDSLTNTNECVKILKLLMDQGALIDSKSYGKHRPFESAIRSGNMEAIKFFVGHVSHQRTNHIKFPLHRAAFSGNEKVMETIINMNIHDINEWNDSYLSPLYITVSYRQFNSTKTLIELGVNINAPCKEVDPKDATDVSWRTALSKSIITGRLKRLNKVPQHAISHYVGDPNIVRLLLSAGAYVNSPDVYQATELLLNSEKNLNRLQLFQKAESDQNEHVLEIINCLIAQVALMKSQNLRISSNLEKLLVNKIPMCVGHIEHCIDELKVMKNSTLYDRFTVYDLLNGKNITRLVNNDQVISTVQSPDFIENFKVYGKRLIDSFSLGQAKRKFMDHAKNILNRLCSFRFDELDVILYKIMDQLEIKDIRNLCMMQPQQ